MTTIFWKKFKKTIVFLVCIVLIITFMPIKFAMADTENYEYAYNSFDDYKAISTKEDLNNIRNDLSGKYYLTCDIILTKEDFEQNGFLYNNGSGWEPIGNSEEPFTGVFDGNGYSIKNLYIEQKSDKITEAGLFGKIEHSDIRNLKLENFEINVENTSSLEIGRVLCVGNLAGTSSDSIIKDISLLNSEMQVNSNRREIYVGSIVGYSSETSYIDECKSNGEININKSYAKSKDVGGICGNSADGIITKCSFDGNININDSGTSHRNSISIGGICAISNGTIKESINRGNINLNTRDLSYWIGGIAAQGKIIAGCNNYANIICNDNSPGESWLGGIAKSALKVENCNNYGDIIILESDYGLAGGILAGLSGSAVEDINNYIIKNCKNEGYISGGYAGGISSNSSFGTNIQGCANYGNVYGTNGAAGITYLLNGEIINSVNYGNIQSYCPSGIVSLTDNESNISFCINYGHLTSEVDYSNIVRSFEECSILNCIYVHENINGKEGIDEGVTGINNLINNYDDKDYFLGFDFENTWNMNKDGIMVLKAFENVTFKYIESIESFNKILDVFSEIDVNDLFSFDLKKQHAIKYTSSNNDILSIDEKGKVKAEKVGKAKVIATDLISGTEKECEIDIRPINNFEVVFHVENKVYTGEQLYQNHKNGVKDEHGEILEENIDYTVSYENNINVGIAKMTIRGIGNYCGSINLFFEITLPESLENLLGDKETLRIAGSNRYNTSIETADALKKSMGVSKFDTIIVADGRNYADALSGSYLAKKKHAPILLVEDGKYEQDKIRGYIIENLSEGGQVYILGGTAVVTQGFEDSLKDYNVKRLYGQTRFETNLQILNEAGVENEEILICSGLNFADSLSASAVGKPILLVDKSLRPGQIEFLNHINDKNFVIIGGTGAVNQTVENQLKEQGTVKRIYGSNRYATSAAVAEEFFGEGSKAIVLAYGMNFPDGLCAGPLAMSINAPLLLTAEYDTPHAEGYVKQSKADKVITLGGPTLVSDKAIGKIMDSNKNPELDKDKIEKSIDAVAEKLGLTGKGEKNFEMIEAIDGASFDGGIELYLYDSEDSAAYQKIISEEGYDIMGITTIKAIAHNKGMVIVNSGDGTIEQSVIDDFTSLKFI